jgi:hypothetical protein
MVDYDFDILDELFSATTATISPFLACRKSYWENHMRTLRWLLFMTVSYQSTDERDKIYAILGLITQHEERRIRPDYSVPAGRLFREVVKLIIETEDSLDVLSCHSLRLKSSSVPSWVPDFAALSELPQEFFLWHFPSWQWTCHPHGWSSSSALSLRYYT